MNKTETETETKTVKRYLKEEYIILKEMRAAKTNMAKRAQEIIHKELKKQYEQQTRCSLILNMCETRMN